jgi:eukaryotic-like serine/threonine-protein kinase
MIDVGQTVGNYRITAKLGEGGMGIVFLAEHPVIGKKVAMKAIHPELSRNTEVISRFMTEAKSVNQIGHEHIVDISDFGTTQQGEFYFVMEYLQGQALAERLKQMVKIPPTLALNIAAQVADALFASHLHGIVHRDLKPENIYLVTKGTNKDFVKVLDFGLAKLTSQGDEKVSHKTRTGSVMGTPFYMAPEQCEGRASIDHRADIYSLGVILFEMLTGKVPFGGEGYGEIIVKHITVPAPSARETAPELSPAIDLILHRAMAKKPSERFQTMGELQAALLDPDGYAATALSAGVAQTILGEGSIGSMAHDARQRASQYGGSGAVGATRPPSGSPSTFRQTVGELVEDEIVPARHARGKLGMVAAALALAAIAGVVIVKTRGTSDQAPSASASTAVAAAKPPTSVRVNFNSDPTHAMIVRADTGKALGETPLSTELPYSDTAIEFVFKKPGYENTVAFIVPNLPSPLFATLQPVAKPAAKSESAAAKPEPTATPPAAKKPARKKAARVQRLDDDAVLEPTFK